MELEIKSMIIETELDVKHTDLMHIFFKANELVGIVTEEYPVEIRGRNHMMLRFTVTYEPTAVALTFLGIRHAGIKNMFDDYLIKCGVPIDALQPASYHRQLQEERESEQNERFIEYLNNSLKTNGKIDEYFNYE